MKIADIHNELERLAELRRLSISESEGENLYDDITRLAAMICETPISGISLVESDRVWFKSSVGLETREVPRKIAFCNEAIRGDDIFVVDDMLQDARFKHNPLVTNSPNIRSYAGVPMATSRGYKIGTLCVLSPDVKHLSIPQIQALRTLAKLAAKHLESTLLNFEQKLSVTRLESLMDNLNMGVLGEDENRRVVAINSGFFQIFSVAGGNEIQLKSDCTVVMNKIHDLFVDSQTFAQRVTEIIDQRHPIIGEELQMKDGRTLERDYVPTIVDGTYKGTLWVYRDVTEKKEAEKLIELQKLKIISTAKMSALGEMAGGIAHEINNPLTVIQGRSQLLRLLAGKGKLNEEAVLVAADAIDSTSARVAHVVEGLRAFARDGELDPLEEISVDSLVKETLIFCYSRFKNHGVAMIIESIDPNLRLECRPIPVSQVLLNLLNNAFDAAVETEGRWVEISAAEFDGDIEIRVIDSGHGIPKEISDKMMRPFFTTKEVGKGTGLGLSVSKGIVEQHGGIITLDQTHPNTCFVVKLPKTPKNLRKVG